MSREKPQQKRKYDSSRRKAQARETKLRITEAARSLFLEHGYVGTTIEAIAVDARVSRETIYGIFQNKQNILTFLLDISVGGDDLPLHVTERSKPQSIMHDVDQKRQLTDFAQDIGDILSRAAPVFGILRQAANTEAELGRRVNRLHKERLENLKTFVHYVAINGPLRDGISEAQAGETVWALTSPELFNLLAEELGWSKQEYAQWLSDTLTRVLLP